MINVDTVYQRVLAILNKEQRGFLTPQKFNLFANQVQLDILEQYFYDLETFLNMPGNNTVHADQVNILETKIAKHEEAANVTYANDVWGLPSNLWRISQVILDGTTLVQRVDRKSFRLIMRSPLSKPTDSLPIYIETNEGINVYGTNEIIGVGQIRVEYIRIPNNVNWAYTNVLGVPQYNAGNATHFTLDPSEETDVVIGILSLAGVEVKAADIQNYTTLEERAEDQQEIR